jgi:hypothetical protein
MTNSNGSIDVCRVSFERFAEREFGLHHAHLKRSLEVEGPEYLDPLVERYWKFFREGWSRRENLTLMEEKS